MMQQVILAATEQFNNKPKQGITFLQERRIISPSDSPSYAEEVASFLVENPWLDKARIGEYVGDRKNPAVLDAFVKWVLWSVGSETHPVVHDLAKCKLPSSKSSHGT